MSNFRVEFSMLKTRIFFSFRFLHFPVMQMYLKDVRFFRTPFFFNIQFLILLNILFFCKHRTGMLESKIRLWTAWD